MFTVGYREKDWAATILSDWFIKHHYWKPTNRDIEARWSEYAHPNSPIYDAQLAYLFEGTRKGAFNDICRMVRTKVQLSYKFTPTT